jgi:hypothetical protein
LVKCSIFKLIALGACIERKKTYCGKPVLPTSNFTYVTTNLYQQPSCESKLTTTYVAIDKCVTEGSTSSKIVCNKATGKATTTSYTGVNCAGTASPTEYSTDVCNNAVFFGIYITCSASSIVTIWSFVFLSLVYILFN